MTAERETVVVPTDARSSGYEKEISANGAWLHCTALPPVDQQSQHAVPCATQIDPLGEQKAARIDIQ